MTTDVKIHGHKLPDQLIQLIKEGKWELPDNCKKLKLVTGIPWVEEFEFFNLEKIQICTDHFFLLHSEGFGRIYGMESSKKLNQPIENMEIMDIDKSIIIAGAKYEEIVIILDYRISQKPIVRITDPSKNEIRPEEYGFKLRTISNSFAEFVNEIN